MKTKQIPKTQQEFLDWFINHYNENNRGVNDKGKCSYEEGCAIGYWLEPKHAKILDEELTETIGDSDENFLRDYLPPTLLNLGLDFLGEIQTIHDTYYHWTSKGLSKYGMKKVDVLANEFNLLINYKKIKTMQIKLFNFSTEICDSLQNEFENLEKFLTNKQAVAYFPRRAGKEVGDFSRDDIEYGYLSFENPYGIFVKFIPDLINSLEYKNPWDACTGKLCTNNSIVKL